MAELGVRRWLPWVLGVVGLAVVVAGLGVVILFRGLEASVPPRSALPEMPDGVRAVPRYDGCGSGNCYREYTLRRDDGRPLPAAQARRLLGLEQERCRHAGLLDWRPQCTGITPGTDPAVLYVTIGKVLA